MKDFSMFTSLRSLKSRLTLRLRLALWSGGLLFVFTLALILFINITATLVVPRDIVSFARLDPLPEAAASPSPFSYPDAGVSPSPLSRVQWDVLRQVRLISLIGLGLVAVLGGAGAYWLAGRALDPVRQISQTAQQIEAGTLDVRFDLIGPQDELKELADAFDAMLERLESAFLLQHRFVSDAAHEFRTPLASARTTIEVIHADPSPTLDAYRETTEVVERALTRLERLVDDLLVLATEDRTFIHTIISLGTLLEGIAQELETLAATHEVTLQLDGEMDVTLEGNAPLLARVFSNLIENAIRYNSPGGKVIITVQEEPCWVRVSIMDTGIGIPVEHHSHIFERFHRVDKSRGRHLGGAGLGLSIVTHIVQQHDGHVQVSSTPGKGSTFSVCLPRPRGPDRR